MMTDKIQIAFDLNNLGYNCAQSVFSAFAPDFGIDRDKALLISSCFGGGMRIGSACGALTGALMALGLAKGFSQFSPETKAETEALTLQFIMSWKAQIGAINCSEILSVDVSDPEQRQLARENGIFEAHCPNCIETAVKIVSEFL